MTDDDFELEQIDIAAKMLVIARNKKSRAQMMAQGLDPNDAGDVYDWFHQSGVRFFAQVREMRQLAREMPALPGETPPQTAARAQAWLQPFLEKEAKMVEVIREGRRKTGEILELQASPG